MVQAAKTNDADAALSDPERATIPPPPSGDAYSADTVVREAPPEILELIREVKRQHGTVPPRHAAWSPPPAPPGALGKTHELLPPPPLSDPASAVRPKIAPIPAARVVSAQVPDPSISSARVLLAALVLGGSFVIATGVVLGWWN